MNHRIRLADPELLIAPDDAQRLEFTGFLSRLATDMDCPDDLALDLFGRIYQAEVSNTEPVTVAYLQGVNELVWDILQRIGYLPACYVMERCVDLCTGTTACWPAWVAPRA
jgi:hypothetical protein